MALPLRPDKRNEFLNNTVKMVWILEKRRWKKAGGLQSNGVEDNGSRRGDEKLNV